MRNIVVTGAAAGIGKAVAAAARQRGDRVVAVDLDNCDVAAAVAACREVGAELTYSSSKRALSRWVKREAVKAQWAGAGILLNAVAPGVTLTAMTQRLLETSDGVALLSAAAPMRVGRPAQPAEIASCALFLAGAEATLRPEHI